MGHAAVTRADTHRYSETFARGGIGQAGVEAKPFRAWIDSWQMRGLDRMRDDTIAPLELNASGADFAYALRLDADRALVLQGDGRLQPEIGARTGVVLFQPALFQGDRQHHHRRQACRRHRTGLDGSGMEQPAARLRSNRMGLVFAAFEFRRKADAVRLRQTDGHDYAFRQLDLA